jgi:hypothetical protein
MPPTFAHDILLSTQKDNKKLYRKAVEIMAPAMGRRLPKVLEMPKLERHAAFVQLLARSESEPLSFNLLSQWLLREQSPMLCDWLDTLGIAHDSSGCTGAFPPAPSKEVLRAAAGQLLAKYSPGLVLLYLATFNEIDEVRWKALEELLGSEPRLKLSVLSSLAVAPTPAATPTDDENGMVCASSSDPQAATAVNEDDDPDESPAVGGSSIPRRKQNRPPDPITGT